MNFLMNLASASDMILEPRCSRICLFVRLIMPCCLPDCWRRTLPVAVSRKRFFTLDLVFILGISILQTLDLSQRKGGRAYPGRWPAPTRRTDFRALEQRFITPGLSPCNCIILAILQWSIPATGPLSLVNELTAPTRLRVSAPLLARQPCGGLHLARPRNVDDAGGATYPVTATSVKSPLRHEFAWPGQ